MHNSFCVGSPEQMYNCTNYYYVACLLLGILESAGHMTAFSVSM